MDRASPEAIAAAAARHGCRSVAFTYNDLRVKITPCPVVHIAR
jgi:hypothetical protein